jgi:hypothetical protein
LKGAIDPKRPFAIDELNGSSAGQSANSLRWHEAIKVRKAINKLV